MRSGKNATSFLYIIRKFIIKHKLIALQKFGYKIQTIFAQKQA